MMNVEKKILKHLLNDDEYTRKILPFLSGDYFSDHSEKTVYEEIRDYITKYNSLPTHEAIVIEVDKRPPIVTGKQIGRASCRERVCQYV